MSQLLCACIVPGCPNNTLNQPGKTFIKVPTSKDLRCRWLRTARADVKYTPYDKIYFCEDHFNIPDSDSGTVKNIQWVDFTTGHILPSKFKCQGRDDVIDDDVPQDSSVHPPSVNTVHVHEHEVTANKEADSKKDEKKEISNIDKFKRRLIRAIARRRLHNTMGEDEMWKELQKETGCDCRLLWKRMSSVTQKKLRRLLAAHDRYQIITEVARLSVTDWLVFDLVLVHEDLDVIGQDTIECNDNTDSDVLEDLYNLVMKYMIEELHGDDLARAWMFLTIEYNGKERQCSPMLLQKRWYQLKEASRNKFYKFWFTYRGYEKNLDRALHNKPSPLQMKIAEKINKVVTEQFLGWNELVQQKRVLLPEDFERIKPKANPKKTVENLPDVEVIEPHVETIDLGVDYDSDDLKDSEKNSKNSSQHLKNTTNSKEDGENSIFTAEMIKLARNDTDKLIPNLQTSNTTIDLPSVKSEKVDDEIVDNVQLLESMHIPSETEKNVNNDGTVPSNIPVEVNSVIDRNSDAIIFDQTNDITLPKISNVIGAAEIAELNNALGTNIVTIEKHSRDVCLQPNDDDNSVPINKNNNSFLDTNVDDTKKVLDNKKPIDVDMHNLNFIDDGIEFADDGIILDDEEDDIIQIEPAFEIKKELKNVEESITAEDNEEKNRPPKFDIKLLLTPVVYTQRIENMDVFKFIEFHSVRDTRVIECAEIESRPVDKMAYKMEAPKSEAISDKFKDFSDDYWNKCELFNNISNDCNIVTLKGSNWMLQKPKKRCYNPIQMCKNPDFNTRLKRLTAGFLSIERNRDLLQKCKPLTIDLHKSFEAVLTNGSLKVKTDKFAAKQTDVGLTLLKNNKVECTSYSFKPEMQIIQDSAIIDRNKVINLPDIDQIRRVNNKLLTAEVIPIQASGTSKSPEEMFGKINNKFKQNSSIFNLNENQAQLAQRHNQIVNNSSARNNNKIFAESDDVTTNNLRIEKANINISESFENKNSEEIGNIQQKRRQFAGKTLKWSTTEKIVAAERLTDNRLLALDTLCKILNILNGKPVESVKQVKKKGRKPLNSKQSKRKEESEISNNKSKKNLSNETLIIDGFHEKEFSNVPEVTSAIKMLSTSIISSSTIRTSLNKTSEVLSTKLSEDVKNTETVMSTKPNPKKTKSEPPNKSPWRAICFTTKSGIPYCCWINAYSCGVANLEEHNCPADSICGCCCKGLVSETLSVEPVILPVKASHGYFNILCDESIVLSDEDNQIEKKTGDKEETRLVDKIGPLSGNEIDTNTAEPRSFEHISSSTDIISDSNSQNNLTISTPSSNSCFVGNNSADIFVSDIPKCKTKVVHATNNRTKSKKERGPELLSNKISVNSFDQQLYKNIKISPEKIINSNIQNATIIPAPNSPSCFVEISTSGCNVSAAQIQKKKSIKKSTENLINCNIQNTATIPAPNLPSCSVEISTNSSNVSNAQIQNKSTNIVVSETQSCEPKTMYTPSTCAVSTKKQDLYSNCTRNENNIKGDFKKPAEIIFFNESYICNRLTQKPIYLGKNKILLYSIPANNSPNSALSQQTLPQGMRLVLLPNGELALSTDSNNSLDENQLAMLPTIINAVQGQIKSFGLESLGHQNILMPTDVTNVDNKGQGDHTFNPNESSSNIDLTMDKQTNQIGISNQIEKPVPTNSNAESVTQVPAVISTSNSNSGVVSIKKIEVEIEHSDSNIEKDSPPNIASVPDTNEETSDIVKKSILSDLMEMSGISSEDTKNISNVHQSPQMHVEQLLTSETKSKDIELNMHSTPPKVLQTKPSKGATLKDFNYNQNVLIALAKRPDLKMLSTFSELKKAFEDKRRFYKIDTDTGIIEVINVSIQKIFQPPMNVSERKAQNVTVDLTDDTDDTDETGVLKQAIIVKQQRKFDKKSSDQKITYSFEIIPGNKKRVNEQNVTPVRLFKSCEASAVKTNLKNTIVAPVHRAILPVASVPNKVRVIGKRKQAMNNILIDLDSETSTIEPSSSKITQELDKSYDSSDSDDEPLAKKAHRIREAISSNDTLIVGDIGNIITGKLDTGIEYKDCNMFLNNEPQYIPMEETLEGNEEQVSDLYFNNCTSPTPFIENADTMSDEDCILGI